MVERRVCTFCGIDIEPGTGRMYIKKDGVIYQFCSSKCFKNMVELGRVPRRTTWTRYYDREKQVRLKATEAAAPAKKRKVKKVKAPKKEEPAEDKPEAEGKAAQEEDLPEDEAEKPAEKKPKAAEGDSEDEE
jgi:large subunit ribosomal protein L24e